MVNAVSLIQRTRQQSKEFEPPAERCVLPGVGHEALLVELELAELAEFAEHTDPLQGEVFHIDF